MMCGWKAWWLGANQLHFLDWFLLIPPLNSHLFAFLQTGDFQTLCVIAQQTARCSWQSKKFPMSSSFVMFESCWGGGVEWWIEGGCNFSGDSYTDFRGQSVAQRLKTRFSAHLKPIKADLVAMDVLTNMLARIGFRFCTCTCPDCDVDCGFAEITTSSGKMLPEAYWAPLKQKDGHDTLSVFPSILSSDCQDVCSLVPNFLAAKSHARTERGLTIRDSFQQLKQGHILSTSNECKSFLSTSYCQSNCSMPRL